MNLSEYKYNDVIHRCFRCGYCKFPTDWEDVNNCPAYARFRMESYSTGGRLWLIRAWLNNEIEWSQNLAKIVYACTSCKNCAEKCPHNFNVDIVNMIIAAKTAMVDAGKVPAEVRDFLENTQRHGNPYGISAKKRGDWTEEMDIPIFRGQEYLFYVGCEGSYDTRAQAAARAVARLLMDAGLSMGILGADEIADGNEADMLGEDALFEDLAAKNIRQFSELGVKNIITLSPHAYNAFKNRYPQAGGNFNVWHYTQMVNRLIQSGKMVPPAADGLRITFHDPCFLGRWNQEYDAPRRILNNIKGATCVEMGRNKKGALCCGGGAGNFFTDILGGSEDSPARLRVREAGKTGADVLAVACPTCLMMLEDAVKVEGLEDRLQVLDIAEILSRQ